MIDLKIEPQPDDETCGPTSLHAIYRYYNYKISLDEVIDTVERSHSGGTLSPLLGKHALMHGFSATIYVNNMDLFDPTWFKKGIGDPELVLLKLKSQAKFKFAKNLTQASQAFQDFLIAGGQIRFKTIEVDMLKEYFHKKIPILTGLNSTYLYRTSRECFTKEGVSYNDDIRGTPCGHFVVLCGYNDKNKLVVVADPYRSNLFTETASNYYNVSSRRLINAIMLGVTTFDAQLLIIEPKQIEQNQLS